MGLQCLSLSRLAVARSLGSRLARFEREGAGDAPVVREGASQRPVDPRDGHSTTKPRVRSGFAAARPIEQ